MGSRNRLFSLGIATLCAFTYAALAGCSGAGTTSINGAMPANHTQEPLTNATAPAALTLSGTVTSIVSSTEFNYETGIPYGHVPVQYSASMVAPAGSTIQVGEAVSVTGSLSSQGQMVATAVTFITGVVTSILSPTEFSFQTGQPYGHVPVLYSASMVVPNGSKIQVGQSITVIGSFNKPGQLAASKVVLVSPSPSPTPTGTSSPSPTPSPTVTPSPHATGPYHIALWAADSSGGQGTNASGASVRQLVTYAVGNGKALTDCHSGTNPCKAVFYMDPNHVWNNSPSSCVYQPDASEIAASSESWFVHDTGYSDAAHRVYGKDSSGCVIWEMNPNSAGLQAWWLSYLRANANSYDAYLIDDDMMDVLDAGYFSGSGGGCAPWPSYCYSTQEIPNDAAEVSARVSFVNALSHSNGSPMEFYYQQASFNIPLDLSPFTSTDRFMAMSCEGCVSTTASPARPTLYAKVLNEMASVNNTSGAYLAISKGDSPNGSATQILQRFVTIGIAWLAYSEGHTIVRPNLESNTNNLAVWPEDLIYPSSPVESMLTSSTDLQVATGVYRREFATCYNKGVAFGHCATIVNANTSAVTVSSSWLRQTYGHAITLTGGDELSGGSVNLTGGAFTPNSTSVAGSGVLLLAP